MSDSRPNRVFAPHAAVLAWVWPGLGHIVLGQARRGALIMFGVLFLFFSGLLIGGLDVVDSRNDRLWFLAQSVCGPIVFGADFVRDAVVPEINRNWRTAPGSATNELRDAYLSGDEETIAMLRRPSLGHVNEVGTLFIALAGLMNLAVILDALYHEPKEKPNRRSPAKEEAA